MTRRLVVFGFGYSARALAASLPPDGWQVTGTRRGADAAGGDGRGAGRDGNVRLVPFDGSRPLADPGIIAQATHILNSVPPDRNGDPVAAVHGADIASAPDLEWAGYLSTTGVYGTRDGGWVDEDSELLPSGERSVRRVRAEEQWLELARGANVPAHIFRLAGIYGPGRNQLETVRSGTARRIDKPGQVFSRIHVDDIVQVLLASMARPNPGRVYNVCDDLPAPPAEVVAFAAGLLGREPPPLIPFADAEMSPMARSFYEDSKRVRNDRIRNELGVRLRYPTYREGLRALLDSLANESA